MPRGVLAPAREFAHEALLYAGADEFVAATASFIREGVEAGEPVLVVVGAGKIARLREELNGHGDGVLFADMADVGANPARIIPAWQAFVAEHLRDDRPVRGIGEPIWAGRSRDEVVECQRHESLLNLAFADAPAWRLLCPYDTSALDDAVIAEALRSHPIVVRSGRRVASDQYRGLGGPARPFDLPLPEPPFDTVELPFDGAHLAGSRQFVTRRAVDAGLSSGQTHDLVLAVNEILTNSIRHGGGGGTLRMWQDDGRIVCEVEDRGQITDPLVDRRRPDPNQPGGRGLWMANQLCDLVQLRSPGNGTVVRLHMRRS
jgi:anti-sigma regulatory factor (Ser/Thr protein kinase)